MKNFYYNIYLYLYKILADKARKTPLHAVIFAASLEIENRGHKDIVKMLLNAEIDVHLFKFATILMEEYSKDRLTESTRSKYKYFLELPASRGDSVSTQDVATDAKNLVKSITWFLASDMILEFEDSEEL